MRPYADRRVLLGITGGIASYKSAWLARLLTQAGAEVDVVMTKSAQEFVGAITFESLTGRRVYTELMDAGHALDHIRLARSANAIVVAPATADFIARAVHGHANDLLTACLLAAEAPVMLVPAMNDRMWSHPQTTRNIEHARELSYQVLEPETGPLAVGEGSGPGRMPEAETIMAHIGRMLEAASLRGRRVVVTAGPTREAVDPVRFLSNRSSGKMGVAIASRAWLRGADVTLISGPLGVQHPSGATIVEVETTEQMAEAVKRELPSADVLVMAAAPADFRPAKPATSKIKKNTSLDSLALVATPDILRHTLGSRKPEMVVVGFALETDDVLANGRAKLEAKGLDLIVINDATEPGAGFGVDTNRVTLVTASGSHEELALMSKTEVADVILDRVEELLGGR